MKTVIEMAKEAGFMVIHEGEPEIGAWYECFTYDIERFAELVRADEREECAKVCESEWSNIAERMYGLDCADAIRARGQK